MHYQLWGYKVEEKIHMGVRERKRLTVTGLRVSQVGEFACTSPALRNVMGLYTESEGAHVQGRNYP